MLSEYVQEGKIELAEGILWGLVRDYPNDKRVLEQLLIVESRIEENRQIEEGKWKQINENFDSIFSWMDVSDKNSQLLRNRVGLLQDRLAKFQNNVEGFQDLERVQWVEQITARETIAETDYLYLLMKEKRVLENRLSPNEIDAQVAVARDSLLKRDYVTAKAQGLRILRSEPNNIDAASIWAYSTVALVPESVDNKKTILPVVESIVRQVPDNAIALETAGSIYLANGNPVLAEERFKKAHDVDPVSIILQKKYIESMLLNGNYETASTLAKKLWETNQKSDETALLVWNSIQNKTPDDKSGFLNEWVRAVSKSALPECYLAELSYQSGNYDEAIAHYIEADKKRPSKAIYQRLAEINLETGNGKPAIKYLRAYLGMLNIQIETDRASYAKYADMLIREEYAGEMFADVISDSENYLKVYPDARDIRFLLGKAYDLSGDESRAVSSYVSLLKSEDGERVAIPLLDIYLRTKKYDEVRKTGNDLLKRINDAETRSSITSIMDTAETQQKKRVK